MKGNADNVKLTPLDELLGSSEAPIDFEGKNVQELPIFKIVSFPGHPYKVEDDDTLKDMVKSIRANGVLIPVIVRPLESDVFQLISGHRRKRAAELAELDIIPAIVRQMSDDEATILMVDSNIQRERILPSERALAYKMKLEAIKRQGARSDITSPQVAAKSSAQKVGDDAGVSEDQVWRFIRLTELVPELLEKVDTKRVGFIPAVELSYLNQEEQKQLLDTMESEQTRPSLSQAKSLKKLSQDGKLTVEAMSAIMTEKKKDVGKITLSCERITRYFPESYTPQQMESTILELLELWQKNIQS